MSDHVHGWRRSMHLDSCHHHETQYGCDCGAGRRIYIERDISDDPYAAIWMDPTGEETGREGGCERCRELLNGSAPVRSDDIFEAGDL